VRLRPLDIGFGAIARTLSLGSVGYENKINERGPGESYSDVILRLAAGRRLKR
jgi:hypothetical protein